MSNHSIVEMDGQYWIARENGYGTTLVAKIVTEPTDVRYVVWRDGYAYPNEIDLGSGFHASLEGSGENERNTLLKYDTDDISPVRRLEFSVPVEWGVINRLLSVKRRKESEKTEGYGYE